MKQITLTLPRVRQILAAAKKTRALVIGDVMLDHFIWGRVGRISPEAPVPVVDFDRETFIPGGAGNVARNLTALEVPAELFGVVGRDAFAGQLKDLLAAQYIGCAGLQAHSGRLTTTKTRIVAHQQQVVRLDRESCHSLDEPTSRKLFAALKSKIRGAAAVIVGDYGKGVITQPLLDNLKQLCREHAVWLSLDPKPVHHLNLTGMSLITPNRKEAFELARLHDNTRHPDPLKDRNLMLVVERLLAELKPVLLLVTLGELGMLLCRAGQKPFHIPTQAKEVYDVSGAGDTVIATFTLAIAAGASDTEAAIFSNHAAGIVVGKVGTAVTTPDELLTSFKKS
jgi:D-beta-D-heptose 7-phosphate kinase/D-beta-D-heptose 1-phosphate adenosyltransferase